MTAPEVPHGHGGNPVNLLTKKLGPLPAYMYVVLIVGAAYAWKLYRNRAVAVTPISVDPSVVGSAPPPVAGGGSGVPSDGPSGTIVGKTNAEWALTVSNGMIAGGSNPVTVSSAVSKYLAGGLLTASEVAVITVAVQRYGYPPNGVLPIKPVPAPSAPKPKPFPLPAPKPGPKPRPKPPAHKPVPKPPVHKPAPKPAPKSVAHRYTVHHGDTLTSISQHFYGSANGVNKIAAANHIADVNRIYAGQVLVIPA